MPKRRAQVRAPIGRFPNRILMLLPEMYASVYDDIADQSLAEGRAVLSRAQALAGEKGVTAETRLVEAVGAPAGERVVQAAKEWSADLIVCGTHGRRGLRRIVLGSDAEFMVRHTPVPILLIRHDDTSKRQ